MISKTKKAVILFSGGLDSTTCLAYAKSQGFELYALTFDYGQRNRTEILAAQKLAKQFGVIEHKIFPLHLDYFGGSALTDAEIAVPIHLDNGQMPATYVPNRNTIFLSLGLAWAEVIGAFDIFIGVNSIEYSYYSDCRPEYIVAFQKLANLANKVGVEGNPITIQAPLLTLSKAEIIKLGQSQLGIDYSQTITCYQVNEEGLACGICDSCVWRKQGFQKLGVTDPTLYIK